MPEKNLSYYQSSRLILQDLQYALSPKEIEREILQRQLRDSVVASGLRSVLLKDVYKGSRSTFIQNKDGKYAIRKTLNQHATKIDNSHDTNVLVFDVNKLYSIGYFQGIQANYSLYSKGIFSINIPFFMPREEVETNIEYKQIVSYVIVKYKDHLLRFTRHKTKRNKFLDYVDGKYSIGFGGHVQEGDYTLFNENNDSGYFASVKRELFEESLISMENVKSIKMIGVLNDDSTPRGKCHFAFIHLVELLYPIFNDNDKYVNDLQMVSFKDISNEFGSYEWWSKLCLQYYFPNKLNFSCFIDTMHNFKLRNDYTYLATVGEIGSGKSQVSSILSDRYGYIHIPCSKILKEIINVDPEKCSTREEMQIKGYEFITSPNAHKIFAERLASFVEKYGQGYRFVFDGLRYPETLFELQKRLKKKIPIIYVETSKNLQFTNYKERENNNISYEDFMKILEHPVENQIQRFLPFSRIIILNITTYKSLEMEVKKFFDKELIGSSLKLAWDVNANYRHEQILRGNDLTFSKVIVPEYIKQIAGIKTHKDAVVLDIGCGTGILTEILANHVGKIVGIDYSRKSIDIAHISSVKKNAKYECTSIENYHPQFLFDIVISNMTFHTVDHIQKVIGKIYTFLKPQGTLFFTLPHPRYYPMRERVKKVFISDGYDYNKESFHKIPFTISREPEPLPSATPYFHRPICLYADLFYKTGFILIDTHIPFPDDETIILYPDRWILPHVLFGIALKP